MSFTDNFRFDPGADVLDGARPGGDDWTGAGGSLCKLYLWLEKQFPLKGAT